MRLLPLLLLALTACTPSPAAQLDTRRLAVTAQGCAYWINESGRPTPLRHRHGPSCPRTWGGGW